MTGIRPGHAPSRGATASRDEGPAGHPGRSPEATGRQGKDGPQGQDRSRGEEGPPGDDTPRGEDGTPETTARQEEIGDLLRQAAQGDQFAWSRLVERLGPLLWSICRSFRLGEADAADAFQLTWLRLLEHLNSIDNPARLPSWLGTTCRRECLAILRRNKRVVPTDDERVLDRFGEPGTAADQPVLASERDAALWRAFDRLDRRCQELLRILLVDPDGGRVSYELAAAALGMPVGSLGPNRGRCLARLRRWVEAEGIRSPLGDS